MNTSWISWYCWILPMRPSLFTKCHAILLILMPTARCTFCETLGRCINRLMRIRRHYYTLRATWQEWCYDDAKILHADALIYRWIIIYIFSRSWYCTTLKTAFSVIFCVRHEMLYFISPVIKAFFWRAFFYNNIMYLFLWYYKMLWYDAYWFLQ